MNHSVYRVLRYPCNVVGFVRLGILGLVGLVVAMCEIRGWDLSWELRIGIGTWLAVCVLLLDVVDGYLARRYQHETVFGAVFDQTIDLLGHTLVWVLSGLWFAPVMIVIEWTAGLLGTAVHGEAEGHWKQMLRTRGWGVVRYYFGNGGANFLNVYSNIGHFGVLIGVFISGSVSPLGWVLMPGIIVYELVTVVMIVTFVEILVEIRD